MTDFLELDTELLFVGNRFKLLSQRDRYAYENKVKYGCLTVFAYKKHSGQEVTIWADIINLRDNMKFSEVIVLDKKEHSDYDWNSIPRNSLVVVKCDIYKKDMADIQLIPKDVIGHCCTPCSNRLWIVMITDREDYRVWQNADLIVAQKEIEIKNNYASKFLSV